MRKKNDEKGDIVSEVWGGRFSGNPHKLMEEINSSIDVDQRLFAQDILASKAHAKMLGDQGIIPLEHANQIIKGLEAINKEILSGTFRFRRDREDIHMNIELRLKELIGDIAGCLHTARSRNDQVAVDFKLWVRESIDSLNLSIKSLQAVLIEIAEQHSDTLMPGFTHMQIAQPVTLGHHLLAYVEMMGRDRGRLHDCRRRLNESPLGAAALGGTPFPIDRDQTSKTLGFERPMANSIDAVSDRDFAMEYLSVAAILSIHLSRLAEEYILWCSVQFGFAKVGDSFSTGSSIMPQKKNPDAAELVRAKSGRVIGALNNMLVIMKGLPMTYSKDMQEDKEPVFEVHDTVFLVLETMTHMLSDTIFDKKRMEEDAHKGFSIATDLADWLTNELEMPFREAHNLTGKIVKFAEKSNIEIMNLSLSELKSIESRIDERIFDVLNVRNSIRSRRSFGGTAPKNVMASIKNARARFLN